MTEQPKIKRPRLRLVVERGDDLVEYQVQTDNRDAVRFDIMRARLRWPDGEQAPMLWLGACGWSALKRSKDPIVEGVSVEKFVEDLLVDVEAIDENGEPLNAASLAAGAGGAGEDQVEDGYARPFPNAAADD
jgi:hypothetical protein